MKKPSAKTLNAYDWREISDYIEIEHSIEESDLDKFKKEIKELYGAKNGVPINVCFDSYSAASSGVEKEIACIIAEEFGEQALIFFKW
jgi:hypothetical protein